MLRRSKYDVRVEGQCAVKDDTQTLNLSGGRNRATVNEKGTLQLLIPQANYLPPVQPAAGVHVSSWSRRRFLRRTCRWSQTWLHLAVRSGWWRSPGMAAGSLCQNQPLHERMRATLPDWRCQDSEAVQFPCNPALRRRRQLVLGTLYWQLLFHHI